MSNPDSRHTGGPERNIHYATETMFRILQGEVVLAQEAAKRPSFLLATPKDIDDARRTQTAYPALRLRIEPIGTDAVTGKEKFGAVLRPVSVIETQVGDKVQKIVHTGNQIYTEQGTTYQQTDSIFTTPDGCTYNPTTQEALMPDRQFGYGPQGRIWPLGGELRERNMIYSQTTNDYARDALGNIYSRAHGTRITPNREIVTHIPGRGDGDRITPTGLEIGNVVVSPDGRIWKKILQDKSSLVVTEVKEIHPTADLGSKMVFQEPPVATMTVPTIQLHTHNRIVDFSLATGVGDPYAIQVARLLPRQLANQLLKNPSYLFPEGTGNQPAQQLYEVFKQVSQAVRRPSFVEISKDIHPNEESSAIEYRVTGNDRETKGVTGEHKYRVILIEGIPQEVSIERFPERIQMILNERGELSNLPGFLPFFVNPQTDLDTGVREMILAGQHVTFSEIQQKFPRSIELIQQMRDTVANNWPFIFEMLDAFFEYEREGMVNPLFTARLRSLNPARIRRVLLTALMENAPDGSHVAGWE